MKIYLVITFLLFNLSLLAQTEQEKRFLDTLAMGGSYLVGREFPAFNISSAQGEQFSNESVKDKWVFINFWFEDCPPCIAEIQALKDMQMDFRHREDFQLITITFDPPQQVARWMQKNNISFPVCSLAMDEVFRLNFRKGFPANILLDKSGKIAAIELGGSREPEIACAAFKLKFYPLLQ